jgi:uncharacterized protein (TIGR00297 family)
MSPALGIKAAVPRFQLSTPRIIQVSMLGLALLFPDVTWPQAAGCALLALLFSLFILPWLDAGCGVRGSGFAEATRRDAIGFEADARALAGVIIYSGSILLLILIYRHSLYVVAAVWAITALGDGLAGVASQALDGPALPYNSRKSWSGFATFVLAGTLGAYLLTMWVTPLGGTPASLRPRQVLLVSAATALVGAVVESLPADVTRLDDNSTVPLVCGAFMFCACLVERSALDSNLPFLGRRIILAVAINLAFALAALALRTITRSGAIAGFSLGVMVYLGWGWKSFLLLFAFFALGSAATRLGYNAKAARGVAERDRGARSWREAVANLLPGAFFSILVITTHQERAFLAALIAALAEAAGDTVSSEIGQWRSTVAYLITSFRPVPAGDNGAVSLAGSLAGLAAAAAVVALGFALGLCGLGGAGVALGAAIAGNLLDSLLGATLERRGLVGNGAVNFAGTGSAGAVALAFLLRG